MSPSTLRPTDRVRLIHMGPDPDPVPAGSEGSVLQTTDLSHLEPGQVQVSIAWDCGRALAAVCPPDRLERLPARLGADQARTFTEDGRTASTDMDTGRKADGGTANSSLSRSS